MKTALERVCREGGKVGGVEKGLEERIKKLGSCFEKVSCGE